MKRVHYHPYEWDLEDIPEIVAKVLGWSCAIGLILVALFALVATCTVAIKWLCHFAGWM